MLFFAEKCPKKGERFGKGKKSEASYQEGSPFFRPYADGEGGRKKLLHSLRECVIMDPTRPDKLF